MKKSSLLLSMLLISIMGFCQIPNSPSPFHNLVVNEKIHFQGDSINSVYVVIQDLSINSLKDLKAMYVMKVYKSKAYYLKNSAWNINCDEVSNMVIQFTAEFTQGDLFLKISQELKDALLLKNPTWKSSDIVIETGTGQ